MSRKLPATFAAIAVAVVGASLAACTGTVSTGQGDGPVDDAGAGTGARFARLTHAQWENTVHDLLYLNEAPGLSASFQPDPPLGRFDNNVARLQVTPTQFADYQQAAEELASRAVADAAVFDRILPADLPADPAAAARAFIESFGARAFRRPLSGNEVNRYERLYASAAELFEQEESDGFTAGVRLVVQAMLQSPHFLYRSELSADVGAGGSIELDGYEVASRLSYALWNTMPDAALFDAARSGALDTGEGVRAAAARLFDDPRTREQVSHFHFQAFDLREYTDVDKNPELFPEWSPALAEAMQTETLLFLDDVVFEGGSIGDFLTSTRAYVNDDLAAVYGLSGDFGPEFVPVDLPDDQRAGFLTRVGFLTRNATLTEPDPIHRGVFVNLNVLCRDLPALPNLPDELNPVGDTNRERIDSLTGEGTCGAGCHSTMINPPGFALENYDALGRWRDLDSGFPVDAADSYVFPDGRQIDFQNGVELSRLLADAPELHSCYSQQLVEYLLGRDLQPSDQGLVSRLAGDSVGSDLTVRELVIEAVTSDGFRFRAPNAQ